MQTLTAIRNTQNRPKHIHDMTTVAWHTPSNAAKPPTPSLPWTVGHDWQPVALCLDQVTRSHTDIGKSKRSTLATPVYLSRWHRCPDCIFTVHACVMKRHEACPIDVYMNHTSRRSKGAQGHLGYDSKEVTPFTSPLQGPQSPRGMTARRQYHSLHRHRVYSHPGLWQHGGSTIHFTTTGSTVTQGYDSKEAVPFTSPPQGSESPRGMQARRWHHSLHHYRVYSHPGLWQQGGSTIHFTTTGFRVTQGYDSKEAVPFTSPLQGSETPRGMQARRWYHFQTCLPVHISPY